MRTKYKPWAKPYIEEHTEVMCPFDHINNYKNYYLEIGSGKGQFLVNMAKNHPDNLFIGMERNVTCAGFTAKKLVEGEITNAKLVYADAGQVLPSIEAESVEGIFLNFSDPWPKKRHSKRRLTSVSFLEEYKRILKPNGMLVFKTDDLDLFDFSLEMFAEAGFKIVSSTYDYDGGDNDDAVTEYQTKAVNKGVSIKRVVLGL